MINSDVYESVILKENAPGYCAENHLTSVSEMASYVYNGDGQRVKAVVNGVTTVYIGSHYEYSLSSSTAKKYYYVGSSRIAMRDDASSLHWLLSDHLGSTMKSVKASDSTTSERRYRAWGEARFTNGTTPTNYRYTGQYEQPEIGLYYYGARWYDTYLNRWVQPDTEVPGSQGVQAWDRYAYVNNSPIIYKDPTGHMVSDGCEDEGCSATRGEVYRDYIYNVLYSGTDRLVNAEIAEAATVGMVETATRAIWDPIDWAFMVSECLSGECSILTIVATIIPLVPGSVGKYADDVFEAFGNPTGQLHHILSNKIMDALSGSLAR